MQEGVNSPNIHYPKTLSEYNAIILHSSDTTKIWAGGTYIMTRPDSYPTSADTVDSIVYIGNIEELHRYQKNDRVAEFGAMVTLDEMKNAGKNVLPPILFDNIVSLGSSVVTKRATIGGSLSTEGLTTSFPGTLIALNASIEIRTVKNKRIIARWIQPSRLLDKGKFSLPHKSLISRLRISLNPESGYQKFFSTDNFMTDPENALSISFVSSWEQDILQNTNMVLTFPSKGIYVSRDLNNLFTSIRFPIEQDEQKSLEISLITLIETVFQINALQRAMIFSFVENLVDELNEKALSLSSDLSSTFNQG